MRHLNITGVRQAEIEDLAALFAPGVARFAALLRAACEDFPADLLPTPPSMPKLTAAVPA
jgi:hypothetical protein